MKAFFGVLALAALLSGCGGGGGGGGGGGNQPPAVAVCDSPGTAPAGNFDIRDPAGLATAKKTLEYVFDITSVQTLTYSLGRSWLIDFPPPVASNAVVQCQDGGSGTFTRSDPDGVATNVTINETVQVTFNNCKNEDTTLNGGLTISVKNVSGNPKAARPWNVEMCVALVNLTTGNNQVGNGNVSLTIDAAATGSNFTGLVSGPSLKLTTSQTSRELQGFRLNYVEAALDPNTLLPVDGQLYALNGTGAVKVTDSVQGAANGTVNFAIAPDITGTNPNVPGGGTVRVNGATSSSATLVVQDTSFVSIDVGSDGSFEGAQVPWSELGVGP